MITKCPVVGIRHPKGRGKENNLCRIICRCCCCSLNISIYSSYSAQEELIFLLHLIFEDRL